MYQMFIRSCGIQLLLIATCCQRVWATTDSAYVQSPTLLGNYHILLHENGQYLEEEYSYLKYMFGFLSRDTLTQQEFNKKLHSRHWRNRCTSYSICDSAVNRIRNEGAMAVTFSEVYKIAEDRLGKDNWFQKNHVFHWLLYDHIYRENCYEDFTKVQIAYRDKWLQQIDSVKNSVVH